ncbi:MAG: hypothetical protein FJ290_04550 [Planctomycetes bacterium]|nr:hypothetical protein [Planctomycetota bacterium]
MKKLGSPTTVVRTHSLPSALGLSEWEKAELVRFELTPEAEVTTFRADTLALYRSLMLKFASSCAPIGETPARIALHAHSA